MPTEEDTRKCQEFLTAFGDQQRPGVGVSCCIPNVPTMSTKEARAWVSLHGAPPRIDVRIDIGVVEVLSPEEYTTYAGCLVKLENHVPLTVAESFKLLELTDRMNFQCAGIHPILIS